jgi:hypothetical protein
MMEGYPDPETPLPQQQKLLLPAVSDELYSALDRQLRLPLQAGQLLDRSGPRLAGPPVPRRGDGWHRDPAYWVLGMALAMVLIAGVVAGSLVSAAVFTPQFFSQGTPTGPHAMPGSAGELRPTFAAPGGGKGSRQSSQPPVLSVTLAVPTPTRQPPATPVPTASPGLQGGSLSVYITALPGQVVNRSVVAVRVTTTQPSVRVRLHVSYTVSPFVYQSKARLTNENGDATLQWVVRVAQRGGGSVVASVVVMATEQHGQQGVSPVVTVPVITHPAG